jgi:hypothetical protein
MTADDLAIFTDSFDARSHFHRRLIAKTLPPAGGETGSEGDILKARAEFSQYSRLLGILQESVN